MLYYLLKTLLEFDQCLKSAKTQSIIYTDLESLVKRMILNDIKMILKNHLQQK